MSMLRSTVTIEEVARVAGVSRSTVSRVVNGSTAVSAEALQAVRQAIAELNYVPNQAARSLASSRALALGVIIPEDTYRFFGDPFFAAIVSGINATIASSPYVLTLFIASGDPGDKMVSYARSGSIDGAIVVSHHTSDTFVASIAAAMPVVYAGRPALLRPADHYVDVDNESGARDAVEYLIAQGRTRIATITGPSSMSAGVDRLAGYRSALRRARLPELAVEDGDFTAEGGAAAMRRILDRGTRPDAVFIASDLMASGAVGVLHAAGVDIPGETAVIGFDDSPVATSTSPTLTTMRQPSFRQGQMMARVLLDLLAGGEPPHATILPTELIVRASA
ncbi:LacI family DNA-binding transcriptional regulator [Microbacterium sp. SORGH_AS_0888]|uniref:LacI family DNA-binding transcriptional regulator n=1 Tax=Microbacterium sp. SORGH_AS_0888 TaxID=3041791 RepID=UPI002783FF1C|nr:LacI family DNA-binding transcriptional regulator [Microbacterium sp. SORGH_AS_0888]MDQ1129851.1 DNA-binding LacI/PurR family transcriptional regulator [Microbacterium sp. SORGH_AS_0888]